MKPRWMRMLFSCPECGMLVTEKEWPTVFDQSTNMFTCTRCGERMSNNEFWNQNHDKNYHMWNRE